MRIVIEVPDRVAKDAVREHRSVRQQAEYLIARAMSEKEDRHQRDDERQPARAAS
jgi:hypothetical protein